MTEGQPKQPSVEGVPTVSDAAIPVPVPPARTHLVAEALDALERLRAKRLPWSVLATNLHVKNEDEQVRVDLVARSHSRPLFVALHCVAGADAWWFSRHRQVDQPSSGSVCVDTYAVKEDRLEQWPVHFGIFRPEPFRLAAVAEVIGAPDPVEVAVGVLQAQDAIARMWLPGHLERNRAGDRNGVAVVVSIVLTDCALRQDPGAAVEHARPGPSSGGAAVERLEWLWFECGLMRPALPSQGFESRLPYGQDARFTRNVAFARAGSLDALLTSDGWRDYSDRFQPF